MTRTAHLAIPHDADQIGPWQWDGESDRQFRGFTIHTATIRTVVSCTILVRTEGEQFGDGAEWRTVAVDAEPFDALAALTPLDARTLAAALIDAADRIDPAR
jgi:hypothetical protein